jgi:SAM-dependent methyltransferase
MRCIICHSNQKPVTLFCSKDRMFGLPGEFRVRRCIECGLISQYPQLTRAQLSTYYPSASYYSYQERGDSAFRKLRNYLIERFYHPTLFSKVLFWFVNTIPAIPTMRVHGKIMDVGCGNGDTLRSLKDYGWDTYGVDIDGRAIAYARKSGLSHVYRGTYEYLSKYPDNYFDVIRSYHVIEHLDNPNKFIQLSRRKLKPGGEFICGTPNSRSIHMRVFRSFWYNLDAPRHQYIFTPDNLTRLLGQEKFRVSDVQYCSGGGFFGSMQYVLSDLFHTRFNLINYPVLFFLFYPFDWLSDKMHLGDVFVVTARK